MAGPSIVTTQRSPWWRTVLLVVFCVFASMTGAAFSELATGEPELTDGLLLIVVMMAILSVPTLLLARDRAPYVVTLIAAAIGLVLPIGPVTALVALGALLSRRRGYLTWYTTAAVATTTAVSVIRDLRMPRETSFLKTTLGPEAPSETMTDLPWWVGVVVVVLAVGSAVGIGLMVRARREAGTFAQQASAARADRQTLGNQLARQQEREQISREVHDGLGHRLSLLSMHAGVLEADAAIDPQQQQRMGLVRELAQQSVADLNSLLSVLRQPLGEAPVEPDLSLVDLPQVFEENRQAGIPLNATVYLDSAETASPELSRAVYRIVQELLTNARDHAPGQQIDLAVTGGPSRDVSIDSRNRYLPPTAGSQAEPTVPGHGLRGIAERVELLGGRLDYGPDDGGATFRITISLPWKDARR